MWLSRNNEIMFSYVLLKVEWFVSYLLDAPPWPLLNDFVCSKMLSICSNTREKTIDLHQQFYIYNAMN